MEILALLAALCTAPNFCAVHYVDAGFIIELRSYTGQRGVRNGELRCFKVEGGMLGRTRLAPVNCPNVVKVLEKKDD
jgi:hypothetical protein